MKWATAEAGERCRPLARAHALSFQLVLGLAPQALCCHLLRRFRAQQTKETLNSNEVPERVIALLTDIQRNLFERAREFRDSNTFDVQTYGEAIEVVKSNSGFARAFWNGTTEDEFKLKEIQASISCLVSDGESGTCVVSGKMATQKAIIAKAY